MLKYGTEQNSSMKLVLDTVYWLVVPVCICVCSFRRRRCCPIHLRSHCTGRLVSVEGNLRCGPNLHQKSISRKNIKTMRTKTTFVRIVLFVFAESDFWWRLGPQRFDIGWRSSGVYSRLVIRLHR